MLHVLLLYKIESISICSHRISYVFCIIRLNHNIMFVCIIYTYNMPSPIHIHVYVCSSLYICKYCVCPHGPYGLLDLEIKLNR